MNSITEKKLLVLAPYSVLKMDNAPKVRAYNMYKALKAEICTEFISGGTVRRAFQEINFLLRSKQVDYVYVEAMASKLNRFDYYLLEVLKSKGALIFPFIRDLYWKHPETLEINDDVKRWFHVCETEMKWYLKNACALFFPSNAMAETIDFPNKDELPPGGDASRCLQSDLPKNKNIIFVGKISKKAGVETLLKAMRYVIMEQSDAHCTIVGSGNQTLIDKWKLKNWVTFTKGIYWDMPRLMSEAYVATIPWVTYLEHNNLTMPLKLFDYLSFGRPVVVTDCKTMANFIQNNKVGIVTDDSPQEFAKGLLKILNNNRKAEKLGRNAISVVRNGHSWKDRAQELLALMRKYE